MARGDDSRNDDRDFPDVDCAALIRCVDDDIRGAIASIISNLEVIPDAHVLSEREALQSSGLIAARKLDYVYQKLADLASLSYGGLNSGPKPHSLHSTVFESILFASAQLAPATPNYDRPIYSGPEPIAQLDNPYLVRALASILVCASIAAPRKTIRLSFSVEEGADDKRVAWALELHAEGIEPSWGTTVCETQLNDNGLARLHAVYWRSLAGALGIQVSSNEEGDRIVVSHSAPLVRMIHQPAQPVFEWPTNPIVVLNEPPANFTKLPGPYTVAPVDRDINTVVEETGAALVILHQSKDDRDTARLNLSACHQLDIPTLLRASSLSYELYRRYRDHVSAVLVEPSDEILLTRYVVGLARDNRRSQSRRADIH